MRLPGIADQICLHRRCRQVGVEEAPLGAQAVRIAGLNAVDVARFDLHAGVDGGRRRAARIVHVNLEVAQIVNGSAAAKNLVASDGVVGWVVPREGHAIVGHGSAQARRFGRRVRLRKPRLDGDSSRQGQCDHKWQKDES